MKIGVSTLAMYPDDLYLVLERLEDQKVDYCEIINEYPYHQVNSDETDSFDIKYTIHAPISDINLSSPNHIIRRASVGLMKNAMDLAVDLDSEIVVLHPGQLPILNRNLESKILELNHDSLSECSKYAHECGLSICVENMPRIKGLLFQDLEELDKLVREIGADITLDVGHAHNNHFSAKDMVNSSKIKHIHLSDNDGSFDNHQALGAGNIDFKSVIMGLKGANYDGILVVEVKSLPDVEPSLKYLRELV
jgi:sugar phosphate isomerase/epimerase